MKKLKKVKKEEKPKVYCKNCRWGRSNYSGEVKAFKENDPCCQLANTNNYSGAQKTIKIITVKSNIKGNCPHFTPCKIEHFEHPSPAVLKEFTTELKKEVNDIKIEVVKHKWWEFWR